MNKGELIAAITEKMKIVHDRAVSQADVKALLSSVESVVTEELYNGREVAWVGFGKFHAKSRAERTGRNPQTGKPIIIPSAIVPAFSPAKALKDALK